MLLKIRDIIVGVINFFHKPFARLIPAQTFRYIACGGANTVLGLILFKLIYDFGFGGQDVKLTTLVPITTRVATLFMTFCVNFPIGFLLSSYVVFPESQIHNRVQLFRYSLATATFILMSYLLTKFFAFYVPLVKAPVANIFVSLITAVLSYISQRLYTFKITKEAAVPEEEVVL